MFVLQVSGQKKKRDEKPEFTEQKPLSEAVLKEKPPAPPQTTKKPQEQAPPKIIEKPVAEKTEDVQLPEAKNPSEAPSKPFSITFTPRVESAGGANTFNLRGVFDVSLTEIPFKSENVSGSVGGSLYLDKTDLSKSGAAYATPILYASVSAGKVSASFGMGATLGMEENEEGVMKGTASRYNYFSIQYAQPISENLSLSVLFNTTPDSLSMLPSERNNAAILGSYGDFSLGVGKVFGEAGANFHASYKNMSALYNPAQNLVSLALKLEL